MIKLNDEIVEPIVSPEPVPVFIDRSPEGAIVASICGIFAPGEIGRDAADCKRCLRTRMAIGSPPEPQQAETPAWRRSVPLELVGAYAAPAEHDGNRVRPGKEDTPAAAPWPHAHPEHGKTVSAHAIR